MGTKRLGQARYEALGKSLNKRDGGIPIPVGAENPAKYHEFFDDFHTAGAATDAATTVATAGVGLPWKATIATGCSIVGADTTTPGGVIVLTTDSNDGDVINMQALGAGFLLANSKKLWWECRAKVLNPAESSVFLGLASASGAADPTIIAEYDDVLGFGMADGSVSTALNHVVAKGSTETNASLDTATTFATDTWAIYSIYWDGSALSFYIDGTLVSQPVTTNLPDNVIVFPSVEHINQGSSVEKLSIDYMRVVQER